MYDVRYDTISILLIKFEINLKMYIEDDLTNTHFIEKTRFDVQETENFDKGRFCYESRNYNNRTFIYYTAALS